MATEFEHLVLRNAGRIRRIAARYAPTGEAEDLFQEITMALWRGYDNFRGESKIETWLYRVAFNTAMTSVRNTIKDREKSARLIA